MRTNRPARHANRAPRPTLASMLVAATVAAAVTITVTVAVVALTCYLGGASAASRGGRSDGTAPGHVSQHLLDPTVGRGAESQTCKHAPRSPRCMSEGGTIGVVRDRGVARPAEGGDDQTVLIGGEGARPARMPGRVPGRGGWVSELGPSRA